jgi:hypothetical protein
MFNGGEQKESQVLRRSYLKTDFEEMFRKGRLNL